MAGMPNRNISEIFLSAVLPPSSIKLSGCRLSVFHVILTAMSQIMFGPVEASH